MTVFYIALAFSHPDYICAKYNLEYSAKQPVDIAYLNTLSADAAPVLLPYLEQEGIDTSTISNRSWPEDRSWRRFLSHMSDVYEENQSIRHFNLSRYWALRNIK